MPQRVCDASVIIWVLHCLSLHCDEPYRQEFLPLCPSQSLIVSCYRSVGEILVNFCAGILSVLRAGIHIFWFHAVLMWSGCVERQATYSDTCVSFKQHIAEEIKKHRVRLQIETRNQHLSCDLWCHYRQKPHRNSSEYQKWHFIRGIFCKKIKNKSGVILDHAAVNILKSDFISLYSRTPQLLRKCFFYLLSKLYTIWECIMCAGTVEHVPF
jgi:hypothetical protein